MYNKQIFLLVDILCFGDILFLLFSLLFRSFFSLLQFLLDLLFIIFSGRTYKSYFVFLFYIIFNSGLVSFFCIWLSAFINISYWRDFSCSIFYTFFLIINYLSKYVFFYVWTPSSVPLISNIMLVWSLSFGKLFEVKEHEIFSLSLFLN